MSAEDFLRKLRQSPEFTALVNKRLRVCYTLSGIMVTYYSSFYLCMAFLPEFMAARLSASGVISLGAYFGISSMLLSVILAGYYTWWSIYRYDTAKSDLLRRLRHDQGQD